MTAMVWIRKSLDTQTKLTILSQDSQYDLACACGMNDEDRRHRARDDTWIYPVALPYRKSKTFLFKTLLSNVCVNDCRYCPIRADQDPQRCTLEPEELVNTFFDYQRAGKVMGLFLSSGVIGTPDQTMERINTIATMLRRRHFRGYLHLKVIPGASDAAIEEAVSLATTVSINIETAGEQHFNRLCTRKNYQEDVIRPLKLISRLTDQDGPYRRVQQTTQFVVGAADETDREILSYAWGMYTRLHLHRIYFSAYQRGLGHTDLPGEQRSCPNRDLLTREHRLYQVDWLMRKYGFQAEEIPLNPDGNLSLTRDPKEQWAEEHPDFFPLNINRAEKYALLRVPGLGPATVRTILALRKNGGKIRTLRDLGTPGVRLKKAAQYLIFS
ncbi:radical SAM protein [candidate division KSB3 bacterium]|uniref:Radical SAM protein n=1 Tax=candidate division KSB3 bacterium TaxID=2044937 RepID=A0A9D5Q893_9BACT|nr:radical SAM protein [candidate division KSB3 bacterium]MBD3327087.1 radical SAM protein [candidate division KSB3 bacterium]